MGFGLAFGIAAIEPELIPLFFGSEYAGAVLAGQCLAFKIVFIALTNVIGNQYLIPAGKDGCYTASVFVGAAVDIVANFLLIPVYGAFGAALGTVLAEASVFVFQMAVSRGKIGAVSCIARGWAFLLAGLAMALCMRLAAAAIADAVVSVAVKFAVGCVVYLVISLIYMHATKSRILVTLGHSLYSKMGRAKDHGAN